MARENAAIIPVVKDQEGTLWVYLPIEAKKWIGDKISDCITTFGGEVEQESPKLAAARELDEESNGIFLTIDEILKRLDTPDESIEAIYREQSHNFDIRYAGVATQTHIFVVPVEEGTYIEKGKIDKHLHTFSVRRSMQDAPERMEVKNIARVKVSDLYDFFNKTNSDDDILVVLDNQGQERQIPFVSYAWKSFKSLLTVEVQGKFTTLFPELNDKIYDIKERLAQTKEKIDELLQVYHQLGGVEQQELRLHALNSLFQHNQHYAAYQNELLALDNRQKNIAATTEYQRNFAEKRELNKPKRKKRKRETDDKFTSKKNDVIQRLSQELDENIQNVKQSASRVKEFEEQYGKMDDQNPLKQNVSEDLFVERNRLEVLKLHARAIMEEIEGAKLRLHAQNRNTPQHDIQADFYKNLKSSQAERDYESMLARLTTEITNLRDKLVGLNFEQHVERLALNDQLRHLEAQRDVLILERMPLSHNPIVDRAGRTLLKKHDRYYHVLMGGYKENDPSTYILDPYQNKIPFASGVQVVKSILEKGVRRNKIDPNVLGNGAGNFGLGEFGPGLYCSRDLPAYLSPVADEDSHQIRKPFILVFELKEDLDGVYSKPVCQYLREGKYPPLTIIEGYNLLLHNNFIADASENSEINLRHPQMRMVPVGVYEPQNIVEDYYTGNLNPDRSRLTPIGDFCQQHNICLAAEWKNRFVAKIEQLDNGELLIDENEDRLFFKKIPGNVPQVVIKAEVGASQLASILINSKQLIPPVQEMTYDGVLGLAQPYMDMDPLPDRQGHVDFSLLTKIQRTQFFAHLLVNWVISNQDSFAHNFGIDKHTKHIVSFNKRQAFKMFVGSKVISPWVQNQRQNNAYAGPEGNGSGLFYNPDLNQDDLHIEYEFLKGLGAGKFDIDWQADIITSTIDRIARLQRDVIEMHLKDYAKIQFPKQQDEFYNSVLDRAASVKEQVTLFAKLVPRNNYISLNEQAEAEAEGEIVTLVASPLSFCKKLFWRR